MPGVQRWEGLVDLQLTMWTVPYFLDSNMKYSLTLRPCAFPVIPDGLFHRNRKFFHRNKNTSKENCISHMDNCYYIRKRSANNIKLIHQRMHSLSWRFLHLMLLSEKSRMEKCQLHMTRYLQKKDIASFAGKWTVVFTVLCVPSCNMKKGNIDNTH